MEEKIELEIGSLLPGVEDDQDDCIKRLENSLQDQKGILRAHVKRENSPVDLCLHYDNDTLNSTEAKKMAEQAGGKISRRFHHAVIPIADMDCSDCALVVAHSIGRMDGVLHAEVDFRGQKLHVEFDKQKIDRQTIERRIRSLGYTIPATGFGNWFAENRELLFSLFAGVMTLIGWVGGKLLGFPSLLSLAFFISAYLLGSWDISQHVWHALREGHFDTDLLMLAAALGAAALGDFAEGALLLFLFSLGHSLEERALEHARSAVSALAELAPKTAPIRREGREVEMPVEEIQIGDIAILRPGVRIPVDGVITAGQSAVNQASVTGESIPVDKTIGDPVFAGTVNGQGALEVSVTKLAKDSTLARVMKMVEEAQSQKSSTQLTLEKFGRVFVPGVLAATALVIILPPFFGVPFKTSFLRAMTLLVAASPCALALGTPAAMLAGIAQAARNGILIKGGAHLENLGRLKAIAFDKTGTITYGQPEVTDVACYDPALGEEGALALAAALESRSAHPLAQAVVRAAQARKITLSSVGEVISLTGQGLRSTFREQPVLIGSQKLMEENSILLSGEAQARAERLQNESKTVMFLALGEKMAAILALADTLRPNISQTISTLKKLGITETVMLTGDNRCVAAAVAGQAGLSDFRADLMPEDKVAAVRELVKTHGLVAMVGDGVNDVPALANATVGIAMGGAATDVALETADVALMGNDLARLPFAVGLSRSTRAVITQNLWIALGVIGVLVAASLTGWVGIGLAVVFHEGSTIVVVLNALRLLNYRQS